MKISPSRTVADSARPVNDSAVYDAIAEGYAAENAGSLLNQHYNRPEIREMLGEVHGRRVLDAGAGSGVTIEDLLDGGASVVGIDGSAQMLRLARERVGDGAELIVADLGAPLPFDDGAFDDVVCSLTLHNLRDWDAPLTEFRRVLKPGGRLLLSVEHPFAIWYAGRQNGEEPDYFATRPRTDRWEFDGQQADVTFWDRPLSEMIQAFLRSGFTIADVREPGVSPGAREYVPELFADRDDPRFLAFLFVELRR
ncbi:class I SAM-dependent methyltransferase [Brachybacterium fresconis]|uniref:SAM-dependent methyltransferase n=1 Tax=Brachybacterium fresconis TaxID=173363 RepID=A0ABS4YL37_9MICO|nr:methyltransferase domain-containing protein [Brachybacterium fresconis]MBP2409517.1 SAM-dependent methyltransferase [Brachybacterium fresconis]